MKRLFCIILLLAIVTLPPLAGAEQIGYATAKAYSGSMLLLDDSTQLTDAAAIHTHIIDTKAAGSLVIDVIADKGLTVIVTPLPVESDNSVLGKASDTLTIADGGDTDRVIYTGIAAPRAKVVVTKTEAGSSTTYRLTARGTGN